MAFLRTVGSFLNPLPARVDPNRVAVEELLAEGYRPENVEAAFDQIKIATDDRGFPRKAGAGDMGGANLAWSTAEGADSVMVKYFSNDPEGTQQPVWPLVVKEFTVLNDDLSSAQFVKGIVDRVRKLGVNGDGPELVAWGVRPSEHNPKGQSVVRVVTKNLAYGRGIVFAGPLHDLPWKIYPHAALDVFKEVLSKQIRHPDPHIGNTYVVLRRTGKGLYKAKSYYIDVDSSVATLQHGVVVDGKGVMKTDAEKFVALQQDLLRFSRPLVTKKSGLVLDAVDVLGDTERARAIDKEIAERGLAK